MTSIKKRDRKAQAAMEFLMTYGWAILVVLIVIGALAYFGVLNPQQFLPKKCQFGQGIVCQDHKLTINNLRVRLNNALGSDIKIKGLSFVADNGLISCVDSTLDNTTSSGATVDITIGCPTSSVSVGVRLKGKLVLNYTDLQSGFDHSVPGTLLTDVEP